MAAGEGFAEGMKDSEKSMANAASRAVSKAMEAANLAAGVPKGNLLAGIFEAMGIATGRVAQQTLARTLAGLGGITTRLQELLGEAAKTAAKTRQCPGDDRRRSSTPPAGTGTWTSIRASMTMAWSPHQRGNVIAPIAEIIYGAQMSARSRETRQRPHGSGPGAPPGVRSGKAPPRPANQPFDIEGFSGIADDIREFIIENLQRWRRTGHRPRPCPCRP